jgi:hypothetical protein
VLLKKYISQLAWIFFVSLLLVMNASAQIKTSAPVNKAQVRERINQIISETLKRGEFTTPEGYHVVTRIPPSSEDVEEVKSMGDAAIPTLEEHFSSPNGMEYELAMRLFGALGGNRIIEPLRKVIQLDSSAEKRKEALRWITQGPWDLASEILRKSAESDSDTQVRQLAKELLAGYAPQRIVYR